MARQVAEQPQKRGYSRKIGPRSLQTLRSVTEEMRRVYCECRNGQLPVSKGRPLFSMLEKLRYQLAADPLEERLDHLEALVGAREGRRARSNGHGHLDDGYDDDRHDDDHLSRLQ